MAWSDVGLHQSNSNISLQSNFRVVTPMGSPPRLDRKPETPNNDVMSHMSHGDRLMTSTKGSHMTINYK